MDIDHSLELTEVYDRAKTCDALFEAYLAALEQIQAGPQLAVCRDHQERFWSWATGLGVYAEPAISLDRRLADHPSIQELVVLLLELIEVNLWEAAKSCKSRSSDAPEPPSESPTFGISLSTIESAAAVDESPQSEGGNTGLAVTPEISDSRFSWEFRQRVSQEGIEESLKRLVRISKAILESRKTNLAQQVLRDVEKHEHEHSDFKKLIESILQTKWPLAESSLREQILESIIFRRAKILRQRKRQERLQTTRQKEKQEKTQKPKIGMINNPKVRTSSTFGGTQRPVETSETHRALPAPVPKSTGASEKPTTIDGEAFERNFKTISDNRAPSVSTAWAAKFKYPKPPKGNDKSTYAKCPICYRLLHKKDYENATWWRRHVDDDYQIYPCISEECRSPPKFFLRHSKWIQHMEGVHSRHWIRNIHCSDVWYCVIDHGQEPEEFTSHDDFRRHFQASHPIQFGRMDAAEVDMLVESSRVSIMRHKDECPLCHRTAGQLPPPKTPGMSDSCLGEDPQRRIGDQRRSMADHVAEHLMTIVQLSLWEMSLESSQSSGRSSKDAYGNSASDMSDVEHDDWSSLSSFNSDRQDSVNSAEDGSLEDWEHFKMWKNEEEDKWGILDPSAIGKILEVSSQIIKDGTDIDDKHALEDIETVRSELSAVQELQQTLTRLRNSVTHHPDLITELRNKMPVPLSSGRMSSPHVMRDCFEALKDRKNSIRKQIMGRRHTWHVVKSTFFKLLVEEIQAEGEETNKLVLTKTTTAFKMDPFGIIGIIGVVAHILSTCTKLGLSWDDAPEDAKKFHSELVSLHQALSDIQGRIIRDPDFIAAFEGKHSSLRSMLTAPGNSSNGSNPLLDCQTELDRVLKELQKRLDGHRFGWERLRAAFSGEKTQSAIANLQRRCQDIVNMILVDNTTLAVNTNLEVRSKRKELTERHLDEKKRKILDWITPFDFAAQQADNLSRRQEGTGQWLLESPEFQNWIKEDRKTLFCPGIPGAGKTMLSSIVIEHLQDRFGQDSTVGIAYLFCNFRRHDEQRPRELLASILKQLYWDVPAGPNEVEKAYEQHQHGSSSMSNQEIVECLHSVTSYFTKVYVIIDALDECRGDNGYRDALLTTILGLHETANVNCFATSRYIPEIESYFEDDPSVEIRATDEDVMEFLDGHMHKLSLTVRKSEELQGEVKQSIVQAVQGMFLLAKLHLDSLQGKRSVKTIKDALRKLATGSSAYDNAYDEAMERIEGQLADQETLAKDALSWIVCARRPLTTRELQHALAVEEGITEFDEDNITELEDIVSVCAGLVTIDEDTEAIRLVHYTTQEYFDRVTDRWFPNAQRLVVESCITYLSFNAFSSGVYLDNMGKRLTEFPLYEYAALEWGHHAQSISPPSGDLISFLMGSQANLEAAFEVVWNWHPISEIGVGKGPPKGLSGLHLAAYFGLKEAFIMVLERSTTEIDINVRDDVGFTPLFYAVMGGNADFIAWLLSIDQVEVNSKAGHYGYTPIHIAAILGNMAGILPFIESDKADLDAKDRWGRTPLVTAAKNDFVEIVKALVESDRVDINLSNDYGQTPLSYAAEQDQVEVVRFLLGTGKINANVDDEDGQTPLHFALSNQNEETARCLLDSGQVDASLSMKSRWKSTPLDHALKHFGRDHSITELVLDRMKAIGIDIEAALQAAVDKLQ